MTKRNIAPKQAEVETATERQEPTISKVQVDKEGFVSRDVFAWAGPDTVADDLRDPAIWKKIQMSSMTVLRKYDRVTVFGEDESWMVEGVVSVAKKDSVRLGILKVASFLEVGEGLYRDAEHCVIFDSGWFYIERLIDGVRVSNGLATEAACIHQIHQISAQKVA
jgi:hypothetical protein